MCASTAENLRNFGGHQIIEISSVLHSAHMVSRNQNKFVFYINNYIDWDQFNKLYNLDWIKKDVQNTDTVAHKFRPALTRASNHKLKVSKKKRRKREEMVERRKTKAIAAKRRRDRGGIILSSEKERNYESYTKDDTDLDQANDKYPLQY